MGGAFSLIVGRASGLFEEHTERVRDNDMKNASSFMLRRFAPAALALVMLLSALLVSCGETVVNNGDDTTAPAQSAGTEAASAEVETEVSDDIPEGTEFGGATVSMLYWEDVENQEYFAEEERGALVNDAIFARNTRVSERLKISFEFTPTKGNSSHANNYLDYVKKNVNGGTDPFDIISAYSRSMGLCAYNGLTAPITDHPVVNLSKPWWPESLVSTSTIGGKVYFVSGDISTNLLYMMYVVFYNKDLMEDTHREDPYASSGSSISRFTPTPSCSGADCRASTLHPASSLFRMSSPARRRRRSSKRYRAFSPETTRR